MVDKSNRVSRTRRDSSHKTNWFIFKSQKGNLKIALSSFAFYTIKTKQETLQRIFRFVLADFYFRTRFECNACSYEGFPMEISFMEMK